jgi:hypothetical protein
LYDNGVRIINVATSKNPVVTRKMFPHRNIQKSTWNSDGNTHDQIDRILIDRRWHSSVLDGRSFRGTDCDIDHYRVVSEVRERLAVTKQEAKKFDVERFNLRTLSELDVMKKCQIEISNRFAALENLNDSQNINSARENVKENIKSSAKESLRLYELKQHKSRVDEECLHF